VALAVTLLVGCSSAATTGSTLPNGVRFDGFHPLAPGIELGRGHGDDAFGLSDGASPVVRPQDLTVVRIDLGTPGLRFTTAVAGGPDTPARPGHQVNTTGTSVTDALRQRPELTLAVNANFFWPCCQPGNAGSAVGMTVFGLAIDDGTMVSDPRAIQHKTNDQCTAADEPAVPTRDSTGSTALVIDRVERASIVDVSAAAAPIDPAGVQAAVAGGPQPLVAASSSCGEGDQYPPLPHVPGPARLLVGGHTDATPSPNPPEVVAGRTFVGISGDRHYLYLAVIDGSEKSGAAFFDEASWLSLVGAADGLNLDGGGSSTMAVNESHLTPGADLADPPCPGTGVRLLDDPHGYVVDGRAPACAERLVGNYLGVVSASR
jgi:hypothetical protein